ncbi:MAG: GNAT family N-acetyltransferase [Oscillospiraceae bacterium]|nr:GNAT family N-acetyltransferase [Oscillospiraceae bacterium]
MIRTIFLFCSMISPSFRYTGHIFTTTNLSQNRQKGKKIVYCPRFVPGLPVERRIIAFIALLPVVARGGEIWYHELEEKSGSGDDAVVRKATENDAEQLNVLNNEFNGEGETTVENIRKSLSDNRQEFVVVDDENGLLTGFACVQLKKSFCYDDYMPEITEVYVRPAYRKQGIAGRMIAFAEDYCSKNYPVHKFELLTGDDNFIARSVYAKLGYAGDHELHLSKRIKR